MAFVISLAENSSPSATSVNANPFIALRRFLEGVARRVVCGGATGDVLCFHDFRI